MNDIEWHGGVMSNGLEAGIMVTPYGVGCVLEIRQWLWKWQFNGWRGYPVETIEEAKLACELCLRWALDEEKPSLIPPADYDVSITGYRVYENTVELDLSVLNKCCQHHKLSFDLGPESRRECDKFTIPDYWSKMLQSCGVQCRCKHWSDLLNQSVRVSVMLMKKQNFVLGPVALHPDRSHG